MALNLPLLQNKIKRNSEAYVSEFRQQLRSYEAQLSIFELSPPKDSKEFGRLVTFLSHVAFLFPEDSESFAKSLVGLLDKSYANMDGDLRRTLFQALVLIRNRGNLDPVVLITLCFNLFRCRDKTLRELVFNHILSDIRNVNKTSSNVKLNKSIQNVVFSMLEDSSSIASKKSLQVMIELYKRRVWVDVRTVNMIAMACLSSQPKNSVMGLQFFLGIDDKIDLFLEQEEEEEVQQSLTASTGRTRDKLERASQQSSRLYSKKTASRMRKLAKNAKALKKVRRLENAEAKRSYSPRFPAIDLINDPQGFVEKLFKKLRVSKDMFEVRLLMMNLISRVVGYHKLLLLPFYSYLQKYIQPHQRHVTNILAYLIQASHDLVPPEDLEPLLKHVANQFVVDRSGPEVMAVGINSARELVAKVPLITKLEGMDDLLQDLVMYKTYKRDKSVVMAARSLLNLLRQVNPGVLERKDKGKFHNATTSVGEYGESKAAEGVDGATLLQFLEEEAAGDGDEEEEGGDKPMGETLLEKSKKRTVKQADRIDAKRILSEKDFERIRKLRNKLEREKLDPRARKKKTRKETVIGNNAVLKKLMKAGYEIENCGEVVGEDDDDLHDDIEEELDPFASDMSSDDDDDEEFNNDGSIDIARLEGFVKRRRKELAEKLEVLAEKREHKLNYQNRTGGTSNREKARHKPFLMVSKSTKTKQKQHQSLRHQQMALKKHIKTMEKSKKTMQKIRRKSKK